MIAIIDYGAGNIKSVTNALNKLGKSFQIFERGEDFINFDQKVAKIEKVILPGVGAAGYAMEQLSQRGFVDILRNCKLPFLGICLGMQLLGDFSEEGSVECLGIIPGIVKKIESKVLKVPQIGWNKIKLLRKLPLFDGVTDDECFYFVNSYYFDCDCKYLAADSLYSRWFAGVIQYENFYATQFHPEKSGEIGLKLLNNFCTKC